MIFCSERRPDIVELVKAEEGEKFGPQLVMQRLGKMWNELTEEEKKPYEEKSEADKERYKKEMEEYKAKQGK